MIFLGCRERFIIRNKRLRLKARPGKAIVTGEETCLTSLTDIQHTLKLTAHMWAAAHTRGAGAFPLLLPPITLRLPFFRKNLCRARSPFPRDCLHPCLDIFMCLNLFRYQTVTDCQIGHTISMMENNLQDFSRNKWQRGKRACEWVISHDKALNSACPGRSFSRVFCVSSFSCCLTARPRLTLLPARCRHSLPLSLPLSFQMTASVWCECESFAIDQKVTWLTGEREWRHSFFHSFNFSSFSITWWTITRTQSCCNGWCFVLWNFMSAWSALCSWSPGLSFSGSLSLWFPSDFHVLFCPHLSSFCYWLHACACACVCVLPQSCYSLPRDLLRRSFVPGNSAWERMRGMKSGGQKKREYQRRRSFATMREWQAENEG